MGAVASDIQTIEHQGALAHLRQIIAVNASRTLTRSESGAIFIIETDTWVITLPLASTVPGLVYTFINGGADGAAIITLSPNILDGIWGEIANEAQDSAPSGANGMDLVNTKATSIKGDRVTIISDGNADWFVIEGVGIWASET